ncbi:TPA: fimbria/pilus outer membrane usher protein [Pluralibacter gergoviae]
MQPARRYHLPVSKLLCAILLASPAWADQRSESQLYLAVNINGDPVQGLTRIKKIGDTYGILAEDAARLNIRTDDMPVQDGYVLLAPRDGLKYDYDNLNQALNITADRSRLAGGQHIDDPTGGHYLRESQLSTPVSGVALNYNLFGSHDDDNQYMTAYTEARTFGIGSGTFSTSFNTRVSEHSYSGDNTGTRRLTTYWNWENVDKMLSLTLGDSYTATQSWSNSVRFGGITLTRSYAMQPGVNTSAQDILTDTATLPSTVDLYIDGMRSSSRRVAPGQFTLNTAPILSGTGSAQVVITDINGQQRTVNLALYGSNQLLTAGLTTWTLNAGWVRDDYTEKSFSYKSDFVTVGDIRHGLSQNLTLESHTEQGSNLNNLGVGANYLLSPTLGIVHGDTSWGRYHDDNGMQMGLGWNWNNRILNTSVNHVQRSSKFRDISSIDNSYQAKREDTVFLGWSLPLIGTLGTSFIDRQYTSSTTQYAGLSWSKTVSKHLNLSASFTQALDDKSDATFYLSVNIPLSTSRDNLSAQYNHDKHGGSEQVSMTHSLESNRPGWGWNAAARHDGGDDDTHMVIQRRNTWSDMELGMNNYSSQKEYYASMSGAVGLFMGNLYATRELGESFVLVDTQGVPDVPVMLEHRPVGKTDSHGRLFLNDLRAYQENHINIDALHLGNDYRAPYTSQEAIPRRNGGAFTQFSVYRTRSLLLVARTADGKPVPFAANAAVVNDKGEPPAKGTLNTVVGYDGNVYLEDAPANGRVKISWSSGECTISLPQSAPESTQDITRKEVICQ